MTRFFKSQVVLVVAGTLGIGYWLVAAITSHYSNGPLAVYTQIPLFALPLMAGIVAMIRSIGWGGLKSLMGRMMVSLSIALTLYGVAMGLWFYYLLIQATIPYPSSADYVFVSSMVMWLVAVCQLGIVIGARNKLRNWRNIVTAAVLLTAMLGVGYLVQVSLTGTSILTILHASDHAPFDLIYNFVGLLLFVITLVVYFLSSHYLGGKFKRPVLFILIGLGLHYIAAVVFTRTVIEGTYFCGNIADLIYVFALLFEGIGTVGLSFKRE